MNCHTTIHIKNMVCRRCIIIVNQIFQKHGFEPSSIELGTVILAQPLPKETAGIIRKELTDCGFEWIDDKRTRIIDKYAPPSFNTYTMMTSQNSRTCPTTSAVNATVIIAHSASCSPKPTALPSKNTTLLKK